MNNADPTKGTSSAVPLPKPDSPDQPPVARLPVHPQNPQSPSPLRTDPSAPSFPPRKKPLRKHPASVKSTIPVPTQNILNFVDLSKRGPIGVLEDLKGDEVRSVEKKRKSGLEEERRAPEEGELGTAVPAGPKEWGPGDSLAEQALPKDLKAPSLECRILELTAVLSQHRNQIDQQDKTLHELRKTQLKREEELAFTLTVNDKLQNRLAKGKKALILALQALEQKTREQLKQKLMEDSFRLGRVTTVRSGTSFQEYWEDGKEIVETQHQLLAALEQRDALDKQKRQLKKTENAELALTLPLKLALVAREESLLKQKLEKLEIEKNLHIQESKRIREEDNAAYARATAQHDAWPVLCGRYLLLSLLGKGGYSEVYKAHCLKDHVLLAIKFHQLNADWPEPVKTNYIKHALRENKIHRTLDHPRIVKHYDTKEVDSNCFFTILEYCPGDDLHKYLKKHKTLTEKEAKQIIVQVFEGLAYLDAQPEKIIHYDLKPQNILMNRGEVKITDFGLAKVVDPGNSNVELTSQGVGTYWYLAPECFESGAPKISSKVDVWSAGVILYELIYGVKPFGHNMPQEKILKEHVIANARAVSFPGKPVVSTECKEFIAKCLEYHQDERWDVLEAKQSGFLNKK